MQHNRRWNRSASRPSASGMSRDGTVRRSCWGAGTATRASCVAPGPGKRSAGARRQHRLGSERGEGDTGRHFARHRGGVGRRPEGAFGIRQERVPAGAGGILPIDAGEARIRGEVGSLLERGDGLSPELSLREIVARRCDKASTVRNEKRYREIVDSRASGSSRTCRSERFPPA